MNIVFFGTPEFSLPSLRALHHDERFHIVLVVTQPLKKAGRRKKSTPSPVFTYAEENAISVLTPETLKNEAVQREINGVGADVYVVVAYGKIIPEAIFKVPQHGTVNIHPSALPKLRGPSPIQTALLEGHKETAVSLIVIDEEMDHGPVISQDEVSIAPDDTYLTLAQKLADSGANMLVRDLSGYTAGKIKPREQDHKKATLCSIIKKEDGHVDWSQSSERIYNRWRAFIEWPGIYAFAGDLRLVFAEVIPVRASMGVPAGTLVAREKSLFVQCGAGALEVVYIQPEGRQKMCSLDFINGYQHVLGKTLS